MKNPIVRLVLALLALAAAGGAGYYVFTLEQRAAALRTTERGFGEDVLRLQATLADLRAAEAGYLAIGQNAAVWIEKAAQLRQQADGQLRRLETTPAARDLDTDLATVGEGLASLGRFDQQIRELLRQEETLAASALVFNDSAQVIAATSATLSRVRGAVASKTGSAATELRQQQLYVAAGGGLVVLLVLLLLVPARRPVAGQPGEDEQVPVIASDTTLFAPVPQAPPSHVGVGADLDLALERRSNRGHEVEGDWGSETRESKTGSWGHFAPAREAVPVEDLDVALAPPPSASQPTAAPVREDLRAEEAAAGVPLTVDLSAAARLCTDLARVRDTSELQGLLARAAALLDASGIVVWMGGSDGNVLWPAFSHGYTPHTLSKMQALPRNGGTPVSAAFRTGLMEVVPADGATSGAIVAPILGSNGCVGAMAVEIRHGAETSGAEQALAGIIAAQLATLVTGEQQ